MTDQPWHWRADALSPPTNILQTEITLPIFNATLPLLQTENEEMFYPVPAICHMLGIQAGHYIARWKDLLLWEQARKLTWFDPERGKRLVWCLETEALPEFLACCPASAQNAPLWPKASVFIEAFVNAKYAATVRQIEEDQSFLRDMHTLLRICNKLDNIIQIHLKHADREPASFRDRMGPLIDEVVPRLEPARRLALRVIADFEHDPRAESNGRRLDHVLHIVEGFILRVATQVSRADRDATRTYEEQLAQWCNALEEIVRDHEEPEA